jgi:hypothetical protein
MAYDGKERLVSWTSAEERLVSSAFAEERDAIVAHDEGLTLLS